MDRGERQNLPSIDREVFQGAGRNLSAVGIRNRSRSKAARFRGGDLEVAAQGTYFAVIRCVRSPPSSFRDSTVSPSRFPRLLRKPRMLWDLCRHRHKNHYADVRIMPTCVSNPACGAGIATMKSA